MRYCAEAVGLLACVLHVILTYFFSTDNCHFHHRAEVDGYLNARQPGGWLGGLRGRLLLPPGEVVAAGTHYDTPLINALVFYVGIRVRLK